MCLLCVADEVPQPLQHCGVCGCPIVIYDGAYYCTPKECWCDKQPDVGDWHALRDDNEPPIEDGKAWVDSVRESWIEGFGGTVDDKS